MAVTQAQVRDHRGNSFGVAFCVAPRFMVTCAHVVADALGIDSKQRGQPGSDQKVYLHFFQANNNTATFVATIRAWYPCIDPDDEGVDDRRFADIALLELSPSEMDRLTSAPYLHQMEAARLLAEHEIPEDRLFDSYGNGGAGIYRLLYAEADLPIGIYVSGDEFIPGFSGSPAQAKPGVLGMITWVASKKTKLIPSDVLHYILTKTIALPALPKQVHDVEPRSKIILKKRDLWILKDRESVISCIEDALIHSPDVAPVMPILVANIHALDDCSDGLISRLEYELHGQINKGNELKLKRLPPPAKSSRNVSDMLRSHERDAYKGISHSSNIDFFPSLFHGVCISGINFEDNISFEFARAAALRWAAVGAGKTGPGAGNLPFFLLLMTDEPCSTERCNQFAGSFGQPGSSAVKVTLLPSFDHVERAELNRWAHLAAEHLVALPSVMVLVRAAQEHVYKQHQRMTMYEWYDGLTENQDKVFKHG